jgi:hypothetical protein
LARVAIAGCFAAAMACSSGHPPPAARATLGGEIARVGDLSIGGAMVAAVASERAVPPASALAGLVEDALLAQGARGRRLDEQPETRRSLQASLAARVVKALEAKARSRGPATEVERSSLEVVHAVVLRASGQRWDDAIPLANAIAKAVNGAATAEAFEERARHVPHPGVRVAVEHLPPFGADGRIAADVTVDPAFVAAAFALEKPGDQSPLVLTRFGWHVIRLVSRIAPRDRDAAPPGEEPPPAVLELRVREATQSILRAARARSRVELESAVEERLAAARVSDSLDADGPAAAASP